MSMPQISNPQENHAKAEALRAEAAKLEEQAVRDALTLVGGNVRQAADLLGIPHKRLDSKLRGGYLAHLANLTRKALGRPKAPPKPKAPAKPEAKAAAPKPAPKPEAKATAPKIDAKKLPAKKN